MSAPVKATRQMKPHLQLPTPSVLAKLSDEDRALLEAFVDEPCDYVAHPIVRKRNVERLLFGSGDRPDQPRRAGLMSLDAVADERTPLSGARAVLTFTTEQEQFAFQCYNYARYRLVRILRTYKSKHLSLKALRELIVWRRRALDARAQIVQANVPLVLAMAKRTRLTGVDFAELISEGNMALLRSVDKFDCDRGFKFSTYACRAILKSFSRVAMKAARYRGRFPTEFDPALERSDYLELTRDNVELDCAAELREIMIKNSADLNDVEQIVIRARFALNAIDPDAEQHRPPMTLQQVGQIIGVTKERVRQIQNKALDKLKTALEESTLAA